MYTNIISALGHGVDDVSGMPQRKRDISVDDSLKLVEHSIYNIYRRAMVKGKLARRVTPAPNLRNASPYRTSHP
jgi:hypothetical protein